MELFEFIKKLQDELKTNPNLPDFLKEEISITKDTMKVLMEENKDVQSFIHAENDRAVSKGIEGFKEKTLPDLAKTKAEEMAEEIYKQKHPEETEEQKEIRLLRERLDNAEREKSRSELVNHASNILNENKLTDMNDFVANFIGEDKETTESNVTKFVEKINGLKESITKQTTEELAKKYGHTPPPSGQDSGQQNSGGLFTYTKE